MNFFHRKPKEVAPMLIKQSDMDIITRLNRTIDERDKAIEEFHVQALRSFEETTSLQQRLEMAHAQEAAQATVIAAQKDTIANLERELADARTGDEVIAKGYDVLVERQREEAATITALTTLSRQAIGLLLQPGGMRLPWQAKRKKLIEEYKAIGIEEE